MPPGSYAGECTATKIYFCKKQILKAVAEQHHAAPIRFCRQILQQQLRTGKGLQSCTARTAEAGSKTGENEEGIK